MIGFRMLKLADEGHVAAAEDELAKLPDEAWAAELRVRLALRRGKTSALVSAAQKFLDFTPDASGRLLAAEALFRAGKLDRAEVVLRGIAGDVNAPPRVRSEGYARLMRALADLNRWTQAESVWKAWERLSRRDLHRPDERVGSWYVRIAHHSRPGGNNPTSAARCARRRHTGCSRLRRALAATANLNPPLAAPAGSHHAARDVHRTLPSRPPTIMGRMLSASLVKDAEDYLLAVGTLFAAAVTLVGVAAGVRGWYRRTLGRRRVRYDRLGRLGTGAQLSFFVAVLGEPPAMRKTITKEDYVEVVSEGDSRFDPELADPEDPSHEVRSPREFTECFFIDRDFYVQTLSDDDETVLAFSVTTRRRGFSPVFESPSNLGWLERWRWRRRFGEKFTPLLRVRLGRTRFADRDPDDADEFAGPHFKVDVGARSYSYSEFFSPGNPGHYQTFVFTASSAAPSAPVGEPLKVREEVGGDEWPDPAYQEDERLWEEMPEAQRFRRETAITTYTVINGGLWETNYPSRFGPHGDEVRTLP